MEAENYKSKTLFVRNLPFVTTNEKLTTLFEDIGPIKQCFVVKKKDSDLCRGFGYVKFSLIEDAIKAKDTITQLDGRKLTVSFADHKRKKPPRKFSKKEDDSESDEEREQEEAKETQQVGRTVEKGDTESGPNQNSKYLKAKIVVLTGFGTDLDLGGVTDLVSHVKKVNKIVYPVEDRNVPTAFLKFKCVRDAKLAIRKVHEKTIKGCQLSAVHLSKEFAEMPQKMLKKCRLIIRNLSFQLGDEELRSHFEGFGELTDVTIPTKPDGKKTGFGFVQFTNIKDAEAAISGMNGVKLKGRPVAVDWALSKHTYEALKDKDTAASSKVDEGSFSAESEEGSESDQNAGSDSESMSSEEEEEQEDSEEEPEEDSDSSGSSDEGSSDEGYSDESEDDTKKTKKKKKPEAKSDISEGKTLFIRNVPFRCEEDDLQDVLSDFGNIVYCKLVMDPYTQHPKGTAFVKFDTVEEADKCLAKSKDTSRNGGITIMDRPLVFSHAVSRKEADDLMDKEKKKENKLDKRNLFLVREGLIRPGTQAAQGISKADLDKRAKIESQMRQKLKNANIFVSSTRLCIQNLPVAMEDAVLRQKILEATDVAAKHITECRIMRDTTRVTNKSKGKSRGYAFVDFSEHQHALEALKTINNTVHGGKRLIVHFSLEDQRMLLIRQKKLEKMKARKAAVMKKDTSEDTKGGSSSQKSVSVKLGQVKASAKRKSEQDLVARKLWTGPKGLPSHSGAKVRHKSRQGQGQGQGQGKGEKKDHMRKGQKRPASNISEKEPAKKKKKKSRKGNKGPGSDNFDRLVQSYKNKMTAAGDSVRQKWFN
ncbi:RNA-binding protein 28-like [Haliotis rufescens]|uniref:RNA-binding protein 28-like n=1 Tax=Haliotis rufescens TaxID=6454 RepID=UPI00201F90FD|nr:RNA-binding protein 28-like [Haliotis rufescens]